VLGVGAVLVIRDAGAAKSVTAGVVSVVSESQNPPETLPPVPVLPAALPAVPALPPVPVPPVLAPPGAVPALPAAPALRASKECVSVKSFSIGTPMLLTTPPRPSRIVAGRRALRRAAGRALVELVEVRRMSANRGVVRRAWCVLAAAAVSLPVSRSALAAPRDAAAERKMREAMTMQFVAGNHAEAEALLLGIDKACEDRCSPRVKARIWLNVGVVRARGRGHQESAREAFMHALRLDPTLALDPAYADESTLATFGAAKAATESQSRGPEDGTSPAPQSTVPTRAFTDPMRSPAAPTTAPAAPLVSPAAAPSPPPPAPVPPGTLEESPDPWSFESGDPPDEDRDTRFGSAGHGAVSVERVFGVYHDTVYQEGWYGEDDEQTRIAFNGGLLLVTTGPFVMPRLALDYLAGDRVSIGTGFGLTALSIEDSDDTLWGFVMAPRVGYMAPLGESSGLWARGGLTYYRLSAGEATQSGLGVTLEVMASVPVVSHFLLLIGPTVDWGVMGKSESREVKYRTFGISVAFAGWWD